MMTYEDMGKIMLFVSTLYGVSNLFLASKRRMRPGAEPYYSPETWAVSPRDSHPCENEGPDKPPKNRVGARG